MGRSADVEIGVEIHMSASVEIEIGGARGTEVVGWITGSIPCTARLSSSLALACSLCLVAAWPRALRGALSRFALLGLEPGVGAVPRIQSQMNALLHLEQLAGEHLSEVVPRDGLGAWAGPLALVHFRAVVFSFHHLLHRLKCHIGLQKTGGGGGTRGQIEIQIATSVFFH